MIETIVIILLILMTAFYVAAEFATVSVRKTKIQYLAERGNKTATKLLPILNDVHKLDEYISVSQIGITLSSMILGAYGQATIGLQLIPILKNSFDMEVTTATSASALIVLILLTSSQMVLGELIPKSLALQYPVQMALYTLRPMQWSLKIFSWFLVILNGSGNAFLKLFNIEHAGHRHVYSTEEISMIIEESRNGGLLQTEETRMLHQALKLDLRTVRQLMVPRSSISSINIELTIEEIIDIVSQSPYTRLPVYLGTVDNIIGILHTKDLVRAYVETDKIESIKDLLLSVTFIPETVKADKVLLAFKNTHSQQAIVIDEFGVIVGLVTLEDVLAEIMGEIGDEFKEEKIIYELLGDGSIRISGLTLVDEAEPLIGTLWDGESDTIGGIVSEKLGRLPEQGEKLNIQNIDVLVEKVENRAVTSIIVKPMEKING